MHRKTIMLVLFDLFLRNKFFSSLQLLGNLSLDFLGRTVSSSFPILHTGFFCLFEPEHPIESPVVAVIVGIRTPDWSHKEQYPNFSFPSVWPPRLPQLHIFLLSHFSLIRRPYQVSAQGFCGYFPCILTLAQRFGLDLSSLWHRPEETWNNYKSPSCWPDLQQSHNPPTLSWG